MERLRVFWSSLDTPRRGLAGLALVAFLAVAIGFGNAVSRPDMALLYGGMDPSEASRVLTALDQRNARYDVRGQSIYVDRAQRDTLRIELAGEGVPSASGAGYELLDSLSGFGTTSQMFDAAYWRAKEGELARTILASPMISDARVHIATAGSSPFRRDSLTTASVAVAGRGAINRETAQALQFLVAAAVADLAPENVSVIDSRTGRVLAPIDELEPGGHAADREQALQARVTRLLEARVGPGNARVEISIERQMRRETVTERQIDPESRVVISQDTEEVSSQASGGPGSVTVASNLPSGDAAGEGDGSSEQRSETRERSNFDVSELRRETVMAPGAIKRLSVAVLVNNSPAGNAGAAAPRSTEEIADLYELVAAAVGYDEERGDVLTLKALDFTASPELGSGPVGSAWAMDGFDPWRLIQLGILALVTIVLGIFVVRPLLLAQRTGPELSQLDGPLAMITPDGQLATDPGAAPGQVIDQAGLPTLENGMQTLSVVPDYDDGDQMPSSPVERLKGAIETRQPDTLEILRSWMEPSDDEKEKA